MLFDAIEVTSRLAPQLLTSGEYPVRRARAIHNLSITCVSPSPSPSRRCWQRILPRLVPGPPSRPGSPATAVPRPKTANRRSGSRAPDDRRNRPALNRKDARVASLATAIHYAAFTAALTSRRSSHRRPPLQQPFHTAPDDGSPAQECVGGSDTNIHRAAASFASHAAVDHAHLGKMLQINLRNGQTVCVTQCNASVCVCVCVCD